MNSTSNEMSQQKSLHTPGPWTADGLIVMDESGEVVASVIDLPDDQSRCESDALLVAAAPELLDALKAALPFIDAHRKTTGGDGDLTAALMRHVIAKAEGGAA